MPLCLSVWHVRSGAGGCVEGCVCQQLSQPLGMAPLFLAGHQVFTLAMSSLCAVGGDSKLTLCAAWDGVRLKGRELCCPSGKFCAVRTIHGSSH